MDRGRREILYCAVCSCRDTPSTHVPVRWTFASREMHSSATVWRARTTADVLGACMDLLPLDEICCARRSQSQVKLVVNQSQELVVKLGYSYYLASVGKVSSVCVYIQ